MKAKLCPDRSAAATGRTFRELCASGLPRRGGRWSVPGRRRRPGPRRSPRGAEPPPPGRQAGRALSRGGRVAQRTVATGGGMDYLTTFTGKSGRLLRGTASRLWGLGGGGEARQVRFEDYLREPAPGDPGCGPAELRPPSPASPEAPGESPSSPRRFAFRRADGDGDRGGGAPGRCAVAQVCGDPEPCSRVVALPARGRRHRLVPIQCVILPSPLPPPTSCDVHGVRLPERRVCAAFALVSRFSWCEPTARAGVLTLKIKTNGTL